MLRKYSSSNESTKQMGLNLFYGDTVTTFSTTETSEQNGHHPILRSVLSASFARPFIVLVKVCSVDMRLRSESVTDIEI